MVNPNKGVWMYLRCWFGRHEPPIRKRLSEHTIAWVCPACERTIGESNYPASEVLQRRRQLGRVILLQEEFQKKQLVRRFQREKSA